MDELVIQTGPVEPLFAHGIEGFDGTNEWDRWYVTGGTWEIGAGYQGKGAQTVANGYYEECQDSQMISPAFVVPSVEQLPRLRFWHYYRFNAGDYGEVQVLPAGSNQWERVSIWGWGNTGGVWVRPSLDLSRWAGQTVQLALHFHSEDSCAQSCARIGPSGRLARWPNQRPSPPMSASRIS